MPTVKLIVTGDMERRALHKSLLKCFPIKRGNLEVEWPTPNKACPATSAKLRNTSHPAQKMVELANTMIAEVLHSKTGTPPDLVLVIDDLELHNGGQEALVVRHFRLAITEAIEKSKYFKTNEAKIRMLLRERCSFHLLKPMVESYLFGDAEAIRLAAAHRMPRVPAGMDLEEFETNDPEYLPSCHKINEERRAAFPDWREERHPKHYLLHLNPDYQETKEGKQALENLRWGALTGNNEHLQVIRALFKDLSEWFEIANPLPGVAHPEFWTDESGGHGKRVLRNL